MERKLYQKPELNSEKLFEKTVLTCVKIENGNSGKCNGNTPINTS